MSSNPSGGDSGATRSSSTSTGPAPPPSLPGYLPWEEDHQMVSRFLDKKVNSILCTMCVCVHNICACMYDLQHCTSFSAILPYMYDCVLQAELEESYQQYITNNPELKAVLADFMQAVLIQKPDNVYVFAKEFFAPFAPNCVPEPSYPSHRVD